MVLLRVQSNLDRFTYQGERERKRECRINVFRLLLKKAEECLVVQIDPSRWITGIMLIDIILPIAGKKSLNLQIIINASKEYC